MRRDRKSNRAPRPEATVGSGETASRIRSAVYDLIVRPLTVAHYVHLFEQLPVRARLLDVGIGTGLMLDRLGGVIREKELRIHGVDVQGPYLRTCNQRILDSGLPDLVSCEQKDVLTYLEEAESLPEHIYFPLSFMVLPDPERILEVVRERLPVGGKVHFAHTLNDRRSRPLEWIKPRLKYLTTIDFGRVTYRASFLDALHLAGFGLTEETPLSRISRHSRIVHMSFCVRRDATGARHARAAAEAAMGHALCRGAANPCLADAQP